MYCALLEKVTVIPDFRGLMFTLANFALVAYLISAMDVLKE
jgi:hypothetical protein